MIDPQDNPSDSRSFEQQGASAMREYECRAVGDDDWVRVSGFGPDDSASNFAENYDEMQDLHLGEELLVVEVRKVGDERIERYKITVEYLPFYSAELEGERITKHLTLSGWLRQAWAEKMARE